MPERLEGCPVQKQRLENKSRIGQDPLHDETAFSDKQPMSPQQVGIAEVSERVEPCVASVGYRDKVHPSGASVRTTAEELPGRPESAGTCCRRAPATRFPGYVTIDPRTS